MWWPLCFLVAQAACLPWRPLVYTSINLCDQFAKPVGFLSKNKSEEYTGTDHHSGIHVMGILSNASTQGANGFHCQVKRWQMVNNYANFFIPHFQPK